MTKVFDISRVLLFFVLTFLSCMSVYADGSRDPDAYSDGYILNAGPYSSEHHFESINHYDWGVIGQQLEYDGKAGVASYDVEGWYGTAYERVRVKAEGEMDNRDLAESQTGIFWSHAVSTFWNTQLGARFDTHQGGEARQWLGAGIVGLAPYWFDVEVMAYVGEESRAMVSIDVDYECLLTQRLILQPRFMADFHVGNDKANGLGNGLSDASLGLRLRYEFSRQLAPYIGVARIGLFDKTADFAQQAQEPTNETRYVAGLRFWF